MKASSAFTASNVACGVEVFDPTHGHANSTEATKARNFFFKMAMHPFSLHIFDQAANGPDKDYFRAAAKNKLQSLMNYADSMAKTQSLAQSFAPVKVGKDWMIYRNSFLVGAVEVWPEADKRVKAITQMLDDFGLLQEDTHDNEAGVCDDRYTQMVRDFGVLVSLIKSELAKGAKYEHVGTLNFLL